MGKLRSIFKSRLIKSLCYKLPIVTTCFCLALVFIMPSASAATNKPIASVQPDSTWYFYRDNDYPIGNPLMLYPGTGYWGGTVHTDTTLISFQSKKTVNVSVVAGKRYIVVGNFSFIGNILADGTFLYGHMSVYDGNFNEASHQPIKYTGNNNGTMKLEFEFVATTTTYGIDLGFIFSTTRTTVWRDAAIAGPLLFYDYEDYFENPRPGVTSNIDGALENQQDIEDELLGGRSSAEIGQDIDDAMDSSLLDKFFLPSDLLSISTFFSNIYTWFGDYSFVLTFSCVVGLAAFILGRGAYAMSGYSKEKQRSNYKKHK